MLSLQGKITLLAYSIIMISFFVPLKGDRSIDKKLALSIVMLIPISISIYSINCLVKGSKWKFGLGCNVLAWINALSVLVSAVILILVNLNKKNIEGFEEGEGQYDFKENEDEDSNKKFVDSIINSDIGKALNIDEKYLQNIKLIPEFMNLNDNIGLDWIYKYKNELNSNILGKNYINKFKLLLGENFRDINKGISSLITHLNTKNLKLSEIKNKGFLFYFNVLDNDNNKIFDDDKQLIFIYPLSDIFLRDSVELQNISDYRRNIPKTIVNDRFSGLINYPKLDDSVKFKLIHIKIEKIRNKSNINYHYIYTDTNETKTYQELKDDINTLNYFKNIVSIKDTERLLVVNNRTSVVFDSSKLDEGVNPNSYTYIYVYELPADYNLDIKSGYNNVISNNSSYSVSPTDNTGSAIDNTGSPTDNTGSAIDNTGSATDNTGSAIDNTVSAINYTGSATDNTGSAINYTGSATDNTGSAINNTVSAINNTDSAIDNTGSAIDNIGSAIDNKILNNNIGKILNLDLESLQDTKFIPAYVNLDVNIPLDWINQYISNIDQNEINEFNNLFGKDLSKEKGILSLVKNLLMKDYTLSQIKNKGFLFYFNVLKFNKPIKKDNKELIFVYSPDVFISDFIELENRSEYRNNIPNLSINDRFIEIINYPELDDSLTFKLIKINLYYNTNKIKDYTDVGKTKTYKELKDNNTTLYNNNNNIVTIKDTERLLIVNNSLSVVFDSDEKDEKDNPDFYKYIYVYELPNVYNLDIKSDYNNVISNNSSYTGSAIDNTGSAIDNIGSGNDTTGSAGNATVNNDYQINRDILNNYGTSVINLLESTFNQNNDIISSIQNMGGNINGTLNYTAALIGNDSVEYCLDDINNSNTDKKCIRIGPGIIEYN
jgi:hypothetical protein